MPDSGASGVIATEDYRLAMTLLDEGIDRCAALLTRHNKGGAYKALLSPVEYADLALRLARALASGEKRTPRCPSCRAPEVLLPSGFCADCASWPGPSASSD